ncbi:MAG: error-prone DNA polymerase, partial [Alphaproteobacteria bacterium]
RERYPQGIPEKVKASLKHELKLIRELDYARYFLTVYDIVRFARSRGILCQGRGSAANSAVCYCLGITSVDTAEIDLLFERFVSAERDEPPDIDVDFEHERREEVIQYIYSKYGRSRAGIAATVITYRARSAVREVGRALGLSEDAISALSGTVWGWSNRGVRPEHVRELGLDPDDPTLARALALTRALIGFPRHLSQHTGGFVITRGQLDEIIPIANAAMEERTVVEWDKDDLATLGLLKIDVLGLGMLTCLRKAFGLLAAHYGITHSLASIPQGDMPTYDMICKADTLGVFQIESRAQMTMLPRLRPRCFYDLVIEVAIVRPGPIQGDMVHPYLRRRQGLEKVEYPTRELRAVLEKTLGVPLFQEQAMKIAIVAAGFTAEEADQLRRAMATFRKTGTIQNFGRRLVEGMVARGYDRAFAERCFKQIEGFGEYGFPESHAASFALLVYVSCWLKCHYPDVFACALLNSQPMGFYAPAQIVRDFRDHGGEARHVDINHSAWDYTLEEAQGPWRALRMGFRQIKGFREAEAQAIMAARDRPFASIEDFARRSRISVPALRRLADADAFRSIGLDRRQALWAVSRYQQTASPPELLADLPLFAATRTSPFGKEGAVTLPDMRIGEHVMQDYISVRMSLKAHPMQLLRARFEARGHARAQALAHLPVGRFVEVAG